MASDPASSPTVEEALRSAVARFALLADVLELQALGFERADQPVGPEGSRALAETCRQAVGDRYGVRLDDFFAGLGNVDHHEWIPNLARHVNVNESALLVELAGTYAASVSENDAVSLRDVLRESVR